VAFDSAARPPLPTATLRTADPLRLRLGLQPYVSLLALHHAVDDYVLAVKQRDRALRAAASNVVGRHAEAAPAPRPPRLRSERVFLAVHRLDNQIYYKRLSHPEYRLLRALAAGRTLADACAAAFRGSRLSARGAGGANQVVVHALAALWLDLRPGINAAPDSLTAHENLRPLRPVRDHRQLRASSAAARHPPLLGRAIHHDRLGQAHAPRTHRGLFRQPAPAASRWRMRRWPAAPSFSAAWRSSSASARGWRRCR
jgi:hypothetical protein